MQQVFSVTGSSKQLPERKRREVLIDNPQANGPPEPKIYKEDKISAKTISEHQGVEEAKKDAVKKEVLDKTKAHNLLKKSNRVLIKTSSVFPFDFFPTRVIIEEARLIVIFRFFFLVSQSHTVDIKDITNVFVGSGPILASLEIVSRTFIENNMFVRNLWRKDAVKIRNMIEGLRALNREQIDTTSFERDELIDEINNLSNTEVI